LIVQRQRDPGDIAVPGSAILSLISTKEIWVSAWVDETEMSHVAAGQPVRVVFRSEPEHPYRGEVARLGRQADRETREFTVDIRVLELPKNWAVGQRAEVFIQTAHKTEATVLPTQNIFWRNGKPGVFVRQGQYAAWRDITLGIKGREVVEVAAGLKPGDSVVLPVDGKNSTIEGRRISVP
jgi:HlyD family secretion protein